MNADTATTVLLLEDDLAEASVLRHLLDSSGPYRVQHARQLAEALAFLRSSARVDAILLDLALPGASGPEALDELQRQAPDVPIVVLTGQEDESLGAQLLRHGAQDYLVKPGLTPAIVRRAIHHAQERQRLRADLRASNERYALAARGANDGLWDWNLLTDQVFYSPRWKSILGFEDHEIGTGVHEWFNRVYSADLDHLNAAVRLHLDGVTEHLECEYRMRHRDGMYRWMLCRGLAVRDASGRATRMVGSQTDVTRMKLAEANLIHDAFHDSLTRLPNRQLFTNSLARLLDRVRNHRDYLFAVLFLDLDGFKVVNDSLGHAAGDQLLVTVARRLERCVRPGDVVARLGGDEFVILLDAISDVSDSLRVAERIHQSLAAPIYLGGHEVVVSASIGIAPSSPSYDRPGDVLRDADTAMYRAKALGKARHVLFDADMHARALARLQLELDFRRALAEPRDFLIFYQPIVCCQTGQIATLEALARWCHPERGWLLPADFIPFAEETGLIVPFGQFVLRKVCAHARDWRERLPEMPLPALGVNLSSRQLTRETVRFIGDLLAEQRAEGNFFDLMLEFGENIFLDGTQATSELLEELKRLGIRLSIDDFGTGFSSLRHLRRSPFQTIKIDRSFVADIKEAGENVEIVRTMIQLGHNLGLATVAEGVETRSQLRRLIALGCEYAQGYLFSEPIHADAVIELLMQGPFPLADVQ